MTSVLGSECVFGDWRFLEDNDSILGEKRCLLCQSGQRKGKRKGRSVSTEQRESMGVGGVKQGKEER